MGTGWTREAWGRGGLDQVFCPVSGEGNSRRQRRWDAAEELFVQVKEIRKRVLWEEHPYTLTSMANLASTSGLRYSELMPESEMAPHQRLRRRREGGRKTGKRAAEGRAAEVGGGQRRRQRRGGNQ
jgi:hypothetical protein